MKYDKRSAFGYLQIGIQLAVSALAGLFVGYWLDNRFGTSPWCIMAGSTVGIAAGLYYAVRQALR